MIKKTFILSLVGLCLLAISSCDDEPCDFDISGTYTFQSASCTGIVSPLSKYSPKQIEQFFNQLKQRKLASFTLFDDPFPWCDSVRLSSD